MTWHQAVVLNCLVGAQTFFLLIGLMTITFWLRAIHSRLDRVPEQDQQPKD